MIKSRYYSESELQRIVSDTELELDRREAQRAEAERLEKVRQWAADPRNAAQLAQIQAEFERVAPPAQQRPTAPAAAPVQRIGFSNAAIDPKVHSPSAKPNSAPAPARYGPSAPSLPPGGFWVL